jgi:hypothetical protein
VKVALGRNLGKEEAFPGSGRVAYACGDQASNRRTAARGSSWRARVMSDRAFALGLGSTGLTPRSGSRKGRPSLRASYIQLFHRAKALLSGPNRAHGDLRSSPEPQLCVVPRTSTYVIDLSAEERVELERRARTVTLPFRTVQRALIYSRYER